MLAQTLADVRKRIARAGSRGLNELETSAVLVEPVLRALGWDIENVDEVSRQHRGPSRGNPVDYALLVRRTPLLLVEVKALSEKLDDRRHGNQIMGYSGMSGVEWIVLTNGDEYRVYNAHARVPIDQKLLRTVQVSKNGPEVGDILGLLAKSEIRTKKIDALWRAHFVDRRVWDALERFFLPEKDKALVAYVRAIAKDLSVSDIRGSMRRCLHTLEFPLSPADLTPTKNPPKGRARKRKVSGGEPVTLADIIRAGLLPVPARLTRHYAGRDVEARVLADGSIEYAGKPCASLSQAGSTARASVTGLRADGRMRATNGWEFWQWKRPDGRLIVVDELRQEYVKREKQAAGTPKYA